MCEEPGLGMSAIYKIVERNIEFLFECCEVKFSNIGISNQDISRGRKLGENRLNNVGNEMEAAVYRFFPQDGDFLDIRRRRRHPGQRSESISNFFQDRNLLLKKKIDESHVDN